MDKKKYAQKHYPFLQLLMDLNGITTEHLAQVCGISTGEMRWRLSTGSVTTGEMLPIAAIWPNVLISEMIARPNGRPSVPDRFIAHLPQAVGE